MVASYSPFSTVSFFLNTFLSAFAHAYKRYKEEDKRYKDSRTYMKDVFFPLLPLICRYRFFLVRLLVFFSSLCLFVVYALFFSFLFDSCAFFFV